MWLTGAVYDGELRAWRHAATGSCQISLFESREGVAEVSTDARRFERCSRSPILQRVLWGKPTEQGDLRNNLGMEQA